MCRFLSYVILLLTLFSCSKIAHIENPKKGELKASYELNQKDEKKFYLDSETAPKPIFMQIFEMPSKRRLLTFLNKYKRTIYMYDYSTMEFISTISLTDKEGPNGLLNPIGYYIKTLDSIYVYDMMKIEIAIVDSLGQVRHRIPLKNSTAMDWSLYYPQYEVSTVVPIIEQDGCLIFTGYAPFAMPAENVEKFRFTAKIDLKTDQVTYHNSYPEELYGFNYNWSGGFATIVYPALSPKGELIHSYPVSHDLYVTNKGNDGVRKVYAGSNFAGTIHSIDHEQRRTPKEMIAENYLREDLYEAIIHDPYRKMYYRFLLKGIKEAKVTTPFNEKEICIVIMDEQFNYLGETSIGTGKDWNWKNAFVTLEGLNIEYISDDIEEDYLILKTFIPQNI